MEEKKRGVPTGGSLCVQLANIAVYRVNEKQVDSDTELMETVKSVKRYKYEWPFIQQ